MRSLHTSRSTSPVGLARRGFLLGAAALGGGLAVGFAPPVAAQGTAPLNPLDVYVRIAPDSTVTVLCAHLDKGQGIYTGLATLVAEELDADWSQMRAEGASGNSKAYGNLAWGGSIQGTGGSTSLAASWERYRRAGAAARAMLIRAAATQWKVDPATVRIEKGEIVSGTRRARFGEFAAAAAALPVPADVPLKPSSAWTLIGKGATPRLDTLAKATGKPVFTIDVDLPGMLTAVVIRPPKFGATVASFEAAAARAVPGVTDVVSIGHAVAIVANGTWPALKARGLVTVTWDESKAEKRSSPEMFARYRETAAGRPQVIAASRGDVEAALAGAAQVIEATYEFPYLAHAAMEPMNCVVAMRDGVVETWSGHQSPDGDTFAISAVAGVAPAKVRTNVLLAGGSFGRRTNPTSDFVVDAVAVGKAIGWRAPVKLQWTREDDMTGGHYRPMVVHRVRAGIDAAGKIVAWDHHVVGQSILIGTPFAGTLVKDGVDPTSVEGAADTPYAFPSFRVGASYPRSPVPVLWWRSVGHSHTAFVMETMLDEIAAATKRDPLALRRELLKDKPRHVAVLDRAVAAAGFDKPAAPGVFRGVALHESFDSTVAHAVEVRRAGDGRFTVERVVGAVDCGTVVNPDQVVAQMEGGVGYALSAIVSGEITLDAGVVSQTNFDTHRVLRIDEMPRVEVHIVPSQAPPTGIGEPPVPPLGPAVANAIAQATGRRVRTLPLGASVAI